MVSTLNVSDETGRASSSQREPQRGAEAISNFYGRYSTDHGSVRPKNTESSLSSYAGSVRRSSSGTEIYSQAHSVNGGDEALPTADGPVSAKGPRVYSSFSAAAAAASLSSLNKRGSQTSLPNNAVASASIRNSLSLSSPHMPSSALGDFTTSSSGAAASDLVPSSALNKGASFDIDSANQFTPGSLANTFPWLSTFPASASKQDSGSPSANTRESAQVELESPPVSQYSMGKGFGWTPSEDHRITKSGSKIRPIPSASRMNMRDTRDSIGRGLGMKSSSELDLPERMRGQRKGALAPPRLSQDPIAISIEEELQPRASAPKTDSAFSRFGRAFRRKSKTGSDLKVDLAADARDIPPLPKTPRRVPSQSLSVKPSDPFAAKALKASSGFVDPALRKPKVSLEVDGTQRELQEVDRRGSTSVEDSSKLLGFYLGQKSPRRSTDGRLMDQQDTKTRTASIVQGDKSRDAARMQNESVGKDSESHFLPSRRDAISKNAEQAIATHEAQPASEDAKHSSKSERSHRGTKQTEEEEAKQVKRETQIRPADAVKVPLTTDSEHTWTGSDGAELSTHAVQDLSKRPTSMESTTSSAHRRSLAFLASAISMGAVAAEAEDGASHAEKDYDEPSRSKRVQDNAHATTNDGDSMDLARTFKKAPPAEQMARLLSLDRKRLEPKSAIRDDKVPSILSDFLSMDTELSGKDVKKGKGKTPSGAPDVRFRADFSTDSSSVPLERSISETSEGRKSSFSTSPKAARATKGVYMSPPAGPSMGGYVSPFYVAPLTSVESGLATRSARPSGRRASGSSRSVHSDDSKSIHSGPRCGSALLAVSDSTIQAGQSAASASRVTESHTEQSRESVPSEKARRVKSFGNLRVSSNDQSQETASRGSTSRFLSASALPNATSGRSRGLSATTPNPSGVDATTTGLIDSSRKKALARSQTVSQRPSQRPKTSGAHAGLGSDRSALAPEDPEGSASSRRGSGHGRASVDDSGRSSKLYSSSPTEADFEMLSSRDQAATPTNQRETTERQRNNAASDNTRVSTSDHRDSSALGRRPSEQSNGAVTSSSSRIESHGGAAALFGNPTARPRTSSLLPSFGFSRSRAGSSAGLEGSGKSPGTFSSGARSASGGFWREPGDPLTPSTTNSQQSDVNGANRSPRASSSSRPSFSRQLSTSTGLSDADAKHGSLKQEKKFSLSAFFPYDDEDAPEYAERIAATAPKTQIAAILASSSDAFYIDALHRFMTRFWFNDLPLDIALRKLLMDLHLPKETQQIDRVMEAFAKRYNECNGGLFASDDQPYILSFSLMMLHTDAFNKNAKNKMTKVDYLRNTGSSGVPTEILEYLYDNLTFTQFIYIEDEEIGRRRPSEASGMSLSGPGMPASLAAPGAAANNRAKIDPYYLITQGRLAELRPDLEHVIPEDTPFSYTGTLPTFDVDRLNSAFLHAPSIEIVTTKTPSEQPGTATAVVTVGEEEVVSLKVTKVGIVNRKDDVSDGGKKSASRKWKTSGLLLTGSQLLLFKDIVWINALQSQILDQVGHPLLCNGISTDGKAVYEEVEGGVVISPRITYFRPDGVISLADAVAVKDHSYGKYDFVFRLLAAKGRQYLVQAQSEDDMNDWIHKINFCASFRMSNIKIRGLDLAPRVGSGLASQDVDTLDRGEALESRFDRPTLSRASFSDSDRVSRRLYLDDSGRSTPAPDDSGESSREGILRPSVDPGSRNSESDRHARPRSSTSHRLSPASSALQKRAKARRELMLTKIAETEVQLERAAARLADEIRLARHFAILTPFLKSTRDRIEMSALPLASRIRALRLDVAKAESRCKILRLDLAAGERVARALLPNTLFSSSAIFAANRMPSGQVGTPQLLELDSITDSQAQFEELFAPIDSGSNNGNTQDPSSTAAALFGTVNKPASHQRNQMNLNAVSEQPADESPVMSSRRQMPDTFAEDAGVKQVAADDATSRQATQHPSSTSSSVLPQSSAENQEHDQGGVRASAADEVPEEWDLSQISRRGTNRISLVYLPSPDELQEATAGRFRFGLSTAK